MGFLTCTLLLLTGTAVLGAAAPKLTLARGGQPTATIVLAADPTPSAQFAALELQYHVQKITGGMLPIVADHQPVSGTRIVVGESALTRRLRLPGAPLAEEEYLIRFLPDTLVLMGRDLGYNARGQVAPPRPVPGKFGRAARFDGKTLVGVPSPGFSDEAGTMEAWVSFPTGAPEKHGTILRLGRKPISIRPRSWPGGRLAPRPEWPSCRRSWSRLWRR